MNIVEKEFRVRNKFGLHGRASAQLVQTAKGYESDIRLIRDDVDVDCKSILDVMSMACTKGTPLIIRARGTDADAALAAIEELINGKFGEE
ncbi:MAG: HPr family phosphocarrier protein [Desulfobulbaceae bacterium]|nr:HPr family phosphocarrier protein [Desulfobulbaceae bacterium]MCK5341080.1 HPr family phosphocarrier protein [Desulfobulbaceae bacterium]MCK5404067.1 HPr family phosphocarrier protein [Desulfobulbaceae bacterium]